ncbi:hypothetical protein EI94DRAFT_1806375 [Lactarius quietus]|nr:hypothetical protein EI94DRAFT_1806375 [Lactarius quietus]
MSQTSPTVAASSRFQAIFQAALNSYQKEAKTDLLAHPLASELRSCDSTTAIIAILQEQIQEFDKSHSGDERLTKWLGPTVNVLSVFSATVSGGVSLTAQSVAAGKDILAELFDRIGYFFTRFETYTEVAPTTSMTDIITQIMVEVLGVFGIATKELRQGSTKGFLRKLAGMTDLEDTLKNLDRLTQEAARVALVEVSGITHIIHDEVKVVDGELESVQGNVDDMGDKVPDIGDRLEGVGDKVEDVGDRVDDVGDKMGDIGDKLDDIGDKVDDIGDKLKDISDKLAMPTAVYGNNYSRARYPSPLRSGFKVDLKTRKIQSEDGSDDCGASTDDNDATWGRPQLFNHGSRPLHTPTHLTAAFRLRMSSQSDLLRCDPISPQFVPPLAVRAEQPYSSLPYPTGDYTYQGSVVVGQGFTFSPPQLPLPQTSSSAFASPSGLTRSPSRSMSVAGLPAPSPPAGAAPGDLPRAGASLVAPPPRVEHKPDAAQTLHRSARRASHETAHVNVPSFTLNDRPRPRQ